VLGIRPSFESGGDPDLRVCGFRQSEKNRSGNQQEKRNGMGIWPLICVPQFTQELAHGLDPFEGFTTKLAGKVN
jgi:hypothetical protein